MLSGWFSRLKNFEKFLFYFYLFILYSFFYFALDAKLGGNGTGNQIDDVEQDHVKKG